MGHHRRTLLEALDDNVLPRVPAELDIRDAVSGWLSVLPTSWRNSRSANVHFRAQSLQAAVLGSVVGKIGNGRTEVVNDDYRLAIFLGML